MQYYKEEMTQEHIDLARSNGIDYQTLWKRYNYYDWSIDKATTRPVSERSRSEHVSYVEVAQANNISKATYYKRISEGMTKEEASTTPIQGLGRRRTRIYTDEQLELANSNGISKQCLDGRLRRGWTLEKAISEPLSKGWARNSGEKTQMFISKKQRPKKQKNYTPDDLKIANSNGINVDILKKRIDRGWSMERATTEKPKTRNKNFIDSAPVH